MWGGEERKGGGGVCLEKVGIKKKESGKNKRVGGEAEASFRSLQSNSPSGSKFPQQPETRSDWLWKGEIKTTVNF